MTTDQACNLAGVDFSDPSRRALDQAIPLSVKLDGGSAGEATSEQAASSLA